MTPEDNFKDSSVVRDQLKSQSVKKQTKKNSLLQRDCFTSSNDCEVNFK